MKKVIQYMHNNLYLEFFCVMIFILSFCFEPVDIMFKGYVNILTSPSLLLTDYVYIGGLGATLFNVSTILAFNLIMLKLLKIKMSGPVYSGIIMIVGFSFFGKNIINTLPIYLGIWLYSIFKKTPFKNFILAILFSTGLSPLVSYTIFGLDISIFLSIPLGIVVGIIVGFIIPAYSSHTIVFHEGYNLYNTGFALGIISAIFFAFFTFFGVKVVPNELYDNNDSWIFSVLLGSMSVLFIFLALIGDLDCLKKYVKLMKTPGRLVSDYLKDFGVETVMLNFGILGLILFLLVLILNIPLNGILFGSILAILGCAAFGLHLRNACYIWIGAILQIVLKLALRGDFNIEIHRDINMLVAFIFASGLAPIAGKYGIIYGIIGGFLHMVLTPLMIGLQGGFDLYNNGLAAGFEASVLAVCAEKVFYKRRNKNDQKSKDM